MAMKFCEGKGSPISGSEKQKLNMDSSTIAELVAVHQFSPKVLWTPLFLLVQGCNVEEKVALQDNKNTILLEENRKRSSRKRTGATNTCHFISTDQIEKGNIKITCCPMDDMVGDFMTKGLQGLKFRMLQKVIVGFQGETHLDTCVFFPRCGKETSVFALSDKCVCVCDFQQTEKFNEDLSVEQI